MYSKILGHLFNPDAGFSLLGHFIGLFCNIFTQVLGSFSVTKLLDYFFYPNAELSLSPIKQNVSQLCQQ